MLLTRAERRNRAVVTEPEGLFGGAPACMRSQRRSLLDDDRHNSC